MPTADLRALAGRLAMLKPCPVHGRPYPSSPDRPGRCPDWCGGREGILPTEAEVRAAIFEAGVHWVEVGGSTTYVGLAFGGDERYRLHARAGEAGPDDLVLLALLRALEACRS